MRYLYSLFLLACVISFYSCTDSSKKEEVTIPLTVANWNDTTAIAKVINDYYKDSVFKAGKIAMEIRDPFMNRQLPYQYLELQRVLRTRLKQTSPTVAYMPVLMISLKDSAIVDFQIEWQQPNPSDSAGVFVVTDKFIQKMGTELRYDWVKENKYWIRKNVEMPEEYKQKSEYEAIDSATLIEMQKSGAI